jgi:hypothetical protein
MTGYLRDGFSAAVHHHHGVVRVHGRPGLAHAVVRGAHEVRWWPPSPVHPHGRCHHMAGRGQRGALGAGHGHGGAYGTTGHGPNGTRACRQGWGWGRGPRASAIVVLQGDCNNNQFQHDNNHYIHHCSAPMQILALVPRSDEYNFSGMSNFLSISLHAIVIANAQPSLYAYHCAMAAGSVHWNEH